MFSSDREIVYDKDRYMVLDEVGLEDDEVLDDSQLDDMPLQGVAPRSVKVTHVKKQSRCSDIRPYHSERHPGIPGGVINGSFPFDEPLRLSQLETV